MGKTILWIYNKPLIPEAGGTERVTSLIMKGLSAIGHHCLGILVVDVNKNHPLVYDKSPITDLYQFLVDRHVDIVINQLGQVDSMLLYFLNKGGDKWHKEGGRIISCLHFNPKPVHIHYDFVSKRNKTLKDYYVIAKTWLLYRYYEKKDMQRIGKVYKTIYDKSDAYVLLSESYREYFEKAVGRGHLQKLHSINNPLTFEDIPDDSICNEKKNTILIVSRMAEWHKRISISLKTWKDISAMPETQNWCLKIVGDGEELEYYKQYARENKLERISFEGQQNPEPYYHEAKIFLMTSTITEGWGLTLTESLQRGVVPVVIDTTSAYHDIITDGKNGFLVREGNISKFKEKILTLITREDILEQMASQALSSAKTFTLSKTSSKWEQIINHL